MMILNPRADLFSKSLVFNALSLLVLSAEDVEGWLSCELGATGLLPPLLLPLVKKNQAK